MISSQLCRHETHPMYLRNLEVTTWCLICQVLTDWERKHFSLAFHLPLQKQRVHQTGSKYDHA